MNDEEFIKFLGEFFRDKRGQIHGLRLKESWFIKQGVPELFPRFKELISVVENPKLSDARKFQIVEAGTPRCPCGKIVSFSDGKITKYCSVKCAVAYCERSEERIKARLEKARLTNLERYGVEYVGSLGKGKRGKSQLPPSVKERLDDKDWLYKEYIENARSSVDIAQELGIFYGTVLYHCRLHGFEIRNKNTKSTEEWILARALVERGFKIQTSRRIKRNREIDIWIPDHKIGIEVNGIYWHSEDTGKGRWYHWDKTSAMRQKGWHLIHFTDWDVNNRLDWCLEVVERNIRKDYPEGDLDLNLYPPVLRGWVEIVPPRAIPNDRYSLGVGDRTYWDVGLMRK